MNILSLACMEGDINIVKYLVSLGKFDIEKAEIFFIFNSSYNFIQIQFKYYFYRIFINGISLYIFK